MSAPDRDNVATAAASPAPAPAPAHAPRRVSTERETIVPADAPAYRDTTDGVYPDEKQDANLRVGSAASSADNNPKEAATRYGDAANSSEKLGSVEAGRPEGEEEGERPGRIKRFYRRHRTACKIAFQALVWVVSTVWLIYGLVGNGGVNRSNTYGWLKPTLFYIATCLRIFFNWVPTSVVMVPLKFVWDNSVVRVYDIIPSRLHQPLAGAGTVAVFLVGAMASDESGDNTRANRAVSIFGLLVMIGLLTLTSRNWRAIPWHTVIGGMLTQFVIAVFVLRTQVGFDIFEFISFLARSLLGFANDGVIFLTADSVPQLKWFFTGVIPAIIFFIALVQFLFHVGLIQWFIGKFATFFFWSLRVSGAEAVVAAATPFIGQGESAVLVKPFVPYMTKAEIHQVMTCGFATIAGSVLVAYLGLGLNPQALVSSCVMSIPASLAVSKLRYPETEVPLTAGKAVIPKDQESKAANGLEAFANGAWLGIKIAGMIISTLLCIIAFVAMIDGILGWWGTYWGIEVAGRKLSLELIFRYVFFPVAWLLGVPKEDCLRVAELIAQKVIKNEFVAFLTLTGGTGRPEFKAMSQRSQLIATYAICGFGNIGSLGTQIGVLSQIAPSRTGDVAGLAASALFSGVLSTLTSASVAGMLYTDAMGAAIQAAGKS
ncbi:hypothetical protein RB597_008788 [Gaeumannomyces tritici]